MSILFQDDIDQENEEKKEEDLLKNQSNVHQSPYNAELSKKVSILADELQGIQKVISSELIIGTQRKTTGLRSEPGYIEPFQGERSPDTRKTEIRNPGKKISEGRNTIGYPGGETLPQKPSTFINRNFERKKEMIESTRNIKSEEEKEEEKNFPKPNEKKQFD